MRDVLRLVTLETIRVAIEMGKFIVETFAWLDERRRQNSKTVGSFECGEIRCYECGRGTNAFLMTQDHLVCPPIFCSSCVSQPETEEDSDEEQLVQPDIEEGN